MIDLESYRVQAEEFSREVTREYYLNMAGLKEELNTAAIVGRHSSLFSGEAVRALAGLASGAESPEEARRLRYLYEFAAEGFLSAAVKEESDGLATAEVRATVPWDGREIPYRYVPVLMANEDDRPRRDALDAARSEVMAREITPRAAEIWKRLYATARELGYDGYISLCRDIKRIDFTALDGRMNAFLSATASIYENHLQTALAAHNLVSGGAKKHDLGIVFRAKAYDRFFPADKAVPALRATLAGLGFDLDEEKAVIIDAEKREKKSPRAFCAPIRVGEEVRLVIAPHGGRDDYDSLLHEAGHAMHFARTAEKAFEYRRLGDNSVTEAFAFLFHYLTTDPMWLRDTLGMDEPQYTRFALFSKLYMLRRYGAKLSYELDLHRQSEADPPDQPNKNNQEYFSPSGNKTRKRDVKPSEFDIERKAEAYRRILSDALKAEYPVEHYLTDLDQGFYAAQYLRAWIFEAQLRAGLKEKFGRRWYRSREAGKLLRDLWGFGQKFTPEELAAQIGFRELDPGVLTEEIRQGLDE